MHGCQSSWQRRRQRGRHEWRIGVFVCYRRLWLVDRGRRCTTVPVHAAPCMSAHTAWTGRAVGREANEGSPAARAWYDPASWHQRLIVLLCSSQTAAGRVDSVELMVEFSFCLFLCFFTSSNRSSVTWFFVNYIIFRLAFNIGHLMSQKKTSAVV